MSKAKELENKQVELKKSTLPQDFEMDEDILALLPRAESTDFIIPRLTLIQPTSRIEGVSGDIVASDSGQKIVGMNEPLEFVPVSFLKDYVISELDSDKFRRNEIKGPDNAHYSVFDNRTGSDPDGVAVKRDERLNLFVVMVSSLDEDFPRLYRLIIKPSSFKEAKTLLSEWEYQISARLFPFSFMWSVTPKEVKNEKGKFSILEFRKVKDGNSQKRVTTEQLAKIMKWVKMIGLTKQAVMKDAHPDDEHSERSSGIPF